MTIKSESNWRGYCIKCNTAWEQGEKCKCEENNKHFIKHSDGSDIYMGELAKEIWNAAIEAALYEIDDSELYCAVARLKK